jgi:hypothetical protein
MDEAWRNDIWGCTTIKARKPPSHRLYLGHETRFLSSHIAERGLVH